MKTESRLAETERELRAIYVIESNDNDAVIEFAGRIPAARMGGAVEVNVHVRAPYESRSTASLVLRDTEAEVRHPPPTARGFELDPVARAFA